MKKISNIFTILLAVAICVGIVASGASAMNVGDGVTVNIENFYEAQSESILGGQIHNTLESFDAGIAVNGTTIINSSGVYVGTVEGTIATTSAVELGSTISVDGAATFLSTLSAEGLTSSTTLAITGASTFTGEIQAQKIIEGGSVTASSTTKALTLTAAQICDSSIIALTGVGADSFAITLPATSTMATDCLDAVGDSVKFLYQNASTQTGTTTTITTNTDYQLLSDDASGDIIAGQDSAWITIIRKATEMIAIVDPFTSAE